MDYHLKIIWKIRYEYEWCMLLYSTITSAKLNRDDILLNSLFS